MATYIDYVVVSGDSLSTIAEAHGTTWPVLAAVNNLPNPNLIYPGQHLSIPVADDDDHGDDPVDVLGRVVEYARAEIGKPYCGPMVGQPDSMRHGNPGWDCSSFASGMYFKATGGATRLTAYTDAAYDQTRPVDHPRAGDLVFYRYDDHDPSTSSRFPHMGIWLNDSQTLDCRHPNGVAINGHLNTPREVRRPTSV